MSPIIGALIGGVIGIAAVASGYFVFSSIGEVMSRKKDRNANHDPSYYARRTGRPEHPQDRLSPSGGHRGGAEARGARAVGGPVLGPFSAGGYTGGGTSPRMIANDFSALAKALNYNFTIQVGGSKPSPEFGGKEFAAGVARGARSFSIDRLGRLTGVSYKVVWRPGENEATCKREYGECEGIDRCPHGFYGYYDGSDDYHRDGMVSAVIEGYGEAVIGTRGFRSMKARIVALHIPDTVKPGEARLVRRNYPDIPVFDTFERMVHEFAPDDGGEGISPASDPDFWTREA